MLHAIPVKVISIRRYLETNCYKWRARFCRTTCFGHTVPCWCCASQVRGGFTFSRQSTVTASAVISGRPAMDPVTALDGGLIEGKEERRQKRKRRRQNLQDETSSKQNPMSASSQTNELTKEMLLLNQPTCDVPTNTVPKIDNYEQNSQDSPSQVRLFPSEIKCCKSYVQNLCPYRTNFWA